MIESMSHRVQHGIKAVLLTTLIGAALAGCTSTLPQFSASDHDIIAAATQKALENRRTGESENWVNPENDHRGTITPTRTFNRTGVPCRRFQQTATLEGQTVFAYDIACRGDDGTWRSDGYASLDGAITDAPYYQDPRLYDRRYSYPYDYPYGYPYGYPYDYPYGYPWPPLHRHR